jgi:molybdopterin converting factor small subunit
MGIFDRMRGDTIRIHVVIKGRPEGEIDEHLRLPVGTTLGKLVDVADGANVPLRHVLDNTPHLVETMTINGTRTPFAENAERELRDGDEIQLVAPT